MVDQSRGSKSIKTTSKQIVRLKGMLKKWQTVTFGSRPMTTHDLQVSHVHEHVSGPIKRVETSPCFDSPIKRVETTICFDSDDESCYSPEPAPDVPKGYLAVYVGCELRRFIIPTSHLSHPVFKILLDKAEEEFGYDHDSALTIPCEIETFKRLLNCMENQTKDHIVGGESPISEHALICF